MSLLGSRPERPSSWELQENGRAFPPGYLHETWLDYLYWDIELLACCRAAFDAQHAEGRMTKAGSQRLSQNEDVRYLGRLLGDVIRAYGGEELFRRIEYIRRASVDRHRGIKGADAVDKIGRASCRERVCQYV